MNKNQKQASKMEDILREINNVVADENASYEQRKPVVMSLLESANDHHPEADENKELYAQIVFSVADFLSDNDDDDMAANLFLKHLELCNKIYGPDSIHSVDSLCNIGYTLIEEDDAETGMAFIMKALEIREKMLGFGHIDTAKNYLLVGGGYKALGDIPHTVEFYEKGKEALLACGETSMAIDIQRAIGVVYSENGMNAEALHHYNKTLEMLVAELGAENAEYAALCNAIGVLLNGENMPKRALEYVKKAVEISQKVQGYFHEETGSYYHNEAMIHLMLDDFSLFSECIEKALEIREAILDANDMDLSDTYIFYALALLWRKDIPSALDYFHKALDIRKLLLGEESEDVNELLSIIDAVMSKPVEDYQAMAALVREWTLDELN